MSINSLSRLLSISLGVLCFIASATAQVFIPPGATDTNLGGGNAITGHIVSATGGRISRRVNVRLQTMTKGDRTMLTDELGSFSFRGLPSGEYAIVIDKEKDFEPARQTVDIRQIRGAPPSVYHVVVILKLKGANGNPGVVNAELADVPARAVAFYNKALEKSAAGKNQEAIDQLKLAIAAHPKFAIALTELGVQYQRVDKLEEAELALKAALDIKPDSFTTLINHGIVLVRLKRYADAEAPLRRALQQKDDSAIAHYYLGRALAYQGRYDIAEVELNLAVTFGGEEMKEAHRYLAGVYSARGKPQRAIAELEIYLKLAPQSPDADHLREMIAKLRASIPPKK